MDASRLPQNQNVEHLVIRTVLGPAALEKYLAGNLPDTVLRPLATGLVQLSERYVHRKPTSRGLSREEAAAYALYYGGLNGLKVTELARNLPHELRTQSHSILDIGCGPGTATLALRTVLPQVASITLVDHSLEMRQLAQQLSSALEAPAAPQQAFATLDAIPRDERFSCIVCAHLLAELSPAERADFLERALARLKPQGVLLLIEPALKETTQLLMADRDRLLERHTDLEVLFPCTHRRECPMRRTAPDSWCHGTLTWDRSPLVRQLDRLTGFNKHRLKYAALVLCNAGNSLGSREGRFRVIEPPARCRRGVQATLCGEGELRQIYLANSERSPSTERFRRLESWDEVSLSRTPDDGNLMASDEVT